MDESNTESLREEFNRWAEAGRGDGMEQDHLPITVPVLEKMRLSATDNVLDVGCGSGWLSRRIGRLVPEGRVVGMDISDEMVRVARRTSAEHDNVLFITGEVSEIPWEANFFTHAISVESAYYWPNPAAGVKEIHRVLRPAGKAWILINYYRDNPYCHQWGELLAVRTHLLSAEEWGRKCSMKRDSQAFRRSELWMLRRVQRRTRGDGSGMPQELRAFKARRRITD